MGLILVDIDDVLFPFAHTYRDFRARRGLSDIPPEAWDRYEINEASIPGHQDLMACFFHDPVVIGTPPLEERADALRRLASRHTIVACTGRYEATEGAGTLEWADLWLPWLSGVEFCGWHPESGRPSSKPSVALRLHALALVDDVPAHLHGLPPETSGLLVERPPGVASSAGALPWPAVAERLDCLSDTAADV